MTGETLFAALGGVEQKYLKDLDLLYRTRPSWREIMKKSMSFTAKAVTAAAVAVVVLGIVFLPGLFQRQEELAPGAASSSEPVVLHVLTERGNLNYLNYVSGEIITNFQRIISEFEKTHENIQIELTYLPVEDADRESALQKLRLEIMAGKGPDLFLLPSGEAGQSYRYVSSGDFLHGGTETLFPDVEMAMRNLYFADLSEYYDVDEDLKTGELQQDVMNAGILDGARYVLPLSFTMNTAVVDLDNLAALGLAPDIFSKSVLESYGALFAAGEALETAEEQGAALFNIIPAGDTLSMFPQVFDYDKEEPAISREDWETWIEFIKVGHGYENNLPSPDFSNHSWSAGGYKVGRDSYFALNIPILSLGLGPNAVDGLGTARTAGRNVEVYPIRAIDGSTIAEVTYYGAVSAACDHPAEAYEFLRTFLTPAVQFQQSTASGLSLSLGTSDESWPVRVVGSVQAKWDALMNVNAIMNDGVHTLDAVRQAELRNLQLSDEDFPFLFEPIDHVRFTISGETELSPWKLVQTDGGERSTEEAVESVMKMLKYHIAEG